MAEDSEKLMTEHNVEGVEILAYPTYGPDSKHPDDSIWNGDMSEDVLRDVYGDIGDWGLPDDDDDEPQVIRRGSGFRTPTQRAAPAQPAITREVVLVAVEAALENKDVLTNDVKEFRALARDITDMILLTISEGEMT